MQDVFAGHVVLASPEEDGNDRQGDRALGRFYRRGRDQPTVNVRTGKAQQGGGSPQELDGSQGEEGDAQVVEAAAQPRLELVLV